MVLMNYMGPSTSKVCFYSELDQKDPNLTVTSKPPTTMELQNSTNEQNVDLENTATTSTVGGVATNLNARQNINLEHQENPEKNDLLETPRKKKSRQFISVQGNLIKKQKMQIKRLQKKSSRYQKKNR
ncbi:hypothetical protein K1T71_002440 [Dendrolimus kikuchii]|uniref:Uncharacterized protein n=1 Tax=Dendrolimus kikuchii TaxID=765133 RepID=A0ACC1DCP7_9NEOP|nr:hypothetical protein K1T71_002440 [Dendrolimus kikuchii]